MDKQTIEATEILARKLLHETKSTQLTVEAIVKIVAAGILDERARVNKRLDHLKRQIGLLRIHETGRRARELVNEAHAEADE
jgi:hypothetical protein